MVDCKYRVRKYCRGGSVSVFAGEGYMFGGVGSLRCLQTRPLKKPRLGELRSRPDRAISHSFQTDLCCLSDSVVLQGRRCREEKLHSLQATGGGSILIVFW